MELLRVVQSSVIEFRKFIASLKTKFILVLIGSVLTYLERENDLKHSLRTGQIPEFW